MNDDNWRENLLEELADLEHQQWIELMNNLFSKLIKCQEITIGKDIEFTFNIKASNYNRWMKQMETSYICLSEKEQELDKKFARKVIKLLDDLGEITER